MDGDDNDEDMYNVYDDSESIMNNISSELDNSETKYL